MRLKSEDYYTRRDLGLLWWLCNTWGFNWIWQIVDAWRGRRCHPGDPEFTFWYFLRNNFRNRWWTERP